MHRWTVNLKFLPEEVFQAKSTAVSLLLLHLTLLIYFAQQKWCRSEGGVLQALRACWQRGHDPKKVTSLSPSQISAAICTVCINVHMSLVTLNANQFSLAGKRRHQCTAMPESS